MVPLYMYVYMSHMMPQDFNLVSFNFNFLCHCVAIYCIHLYIVSMDANNVSLHNNKAP